VNPLDLVPAPVKAYASLAIAAAAVAAAAGLAWWHHHEASAAIKAADAAGYQRGHAELVTYRELQERQALQQAQERRAAELGLADTLKENQNEAQRLAVRDRAALLAHDGRAAAAGDRMQHAGADLAAAASRRAVSGDPAAAGQCAADVAKLADVLGAHRRVIQQLGRDADSEVDDLGRSGGECARSYDAVKAALDKIARQ